jgi:hypothetical protein
MVPQVQRIGTDEDRRHRGAARSIMGGVGCRKQQMGGRHRRSYEHLRQQDRRCRPILAAQVAGRECRGVPGLHVSRSVHLTAGFPRGMRGAEGSPCAQISKPPRVRIL